MTREYRPFYSDAVAELIVGLPKRRQRALIDTCSQLARGPFVESDYKIQDTDGRWIEHLTVNGFVIAYWIDHPACKVMIVEVEDLR